MSPTSRALSTLTSVLLPRIQTVLNPYNLAHLMLCESHWILKISVFKGVIMERAKTLSCEIEPSPTVYIV